MRRAWVGLLLALAVVLCAGCTSTEEKLQAAYENGMAEGRTAGYEEGYGAALEEAEALEDSFYASGREAGYAEGQTAGYAQGAEEGAAAGYEQGHAAGYDEGYAAGYTEGSEAGYTAGYSQGVSDGQQDGYEDGYATGKNLMVAGSEATVYVTKSGTKYHNADCANLTTSKIPIALSDAVAQGYTPCSKCIGQ